MPFVVKDFPKDRDRRPFDPGALDAYFDGRTWCFDSLDEMLFGLSLEELGDILAKSRRGMSSRLLEKERLLYFRSNDDWTKKSP